MNSYIAKEGERLDQITYLFYKNLNYIVNVLEANPHLLDKPILELGDIVYLPEISIQTKTEELKALWN